MLWVFAHYEYFNSYSAGIDFRRQNLTSTVDPRAITVKLLCFAIFLYLVLCELHARHRPSQDLVRVSRSPGHAEHTLCVYTII